MDLSFGKDERTGTRLVTLKTLKSGILSPLSPARSPDLRKVLGPEGLAPGDTRATPAEEVAGANSAISRAPGDTGDTGDKIRTLTSPRIPRTPLLPKRIPRTPLLPGDVPAPSGTRTPRTPLAPIKRQPTPPIEEAR